MIHATIVVNRDTERQPRTANRVRTLSKTYTLNGQSQYTVCRRFIGDHLDQFLSSLGLVKKTLPDDGNTLFRALCEKLSMNQCEFAEIRRLVEDEIEVAYQLLKIRGNLDHNFSDETDILQTITRLLRVNLIIYREVGKDPIIIQGDEKADGKKVSLCESAPDYYELVYPEDIQLYLASSQTIVYEILYKGIFNFSHDTVRVAVDHIRADIDASGGEPPSTPATPPFQGTYFAFNQSISTWKPPFPFSAVKSLDPAIYRNVAFDIFTKKRKLGNEKKAIAMVNSQSVRFRPGSYCLTRDGEKINKVRVVARPGPDQRIIRTETGLEQLVSVSDLRSCGQSSANYHSIIPLPTSPPRPLMATDLPPPISLPIPMFGVVPTLSMHTLPPNPVTPSSIVPCISQPYSGITSPSSVPLFDANVPPPRVMPHPSAPSCTWWEQARPLSCFTTTTAALSTSFACNTPESCSSVVARLPQVTSNNSDIETPLCFHVIGSVRVPFFVPLDMTFVDQTVQPSKMWDASDLPRDPTTLRFFFNMGIESFHTAMRQNVGFSDHNNNIGEGKLRFFPPGVQIIYPTSNYIPVPVCGYGALSPSPVAADLFHGAPGYTQSELPIEHNGTVYFRHLSV